MNFEEASPAKSGSTPVAGVQKSDSFKVKKISHVPPLSTTERAVPSVPQPPNEPLPHSELFRKGSAGKEYIKLDTLRKFLALEGRLLVDDVMRIIVAATEIMRSESTLVSVQPPVTICGDIHGQYYDLMTLLDVGGQFSHTKYVFLGDYVDRGSFSVEVLLLLFAMKVSKPSNVLLLRGNHETQLLCEHFTFHAECLTKYNQDVYEAFLASFLAMPLAAVVGKQFLCVHGGLSPDFRTLDDIKQIDRFREPPSFGPMCDILWSDPAPDYFDSEKEGFSFNDTRGCSYVFRSKAVTSFLESNKLLSLVRAHEAMDGGYGMINNESGEQEFPEVITIFSAPNYLDAYRNSGAVLHYDGKEIKIRQFSAVDHPYWLPNFANAFEWSIPFVTEKVAELAKCLLSLCSKDEDELDDAPVTAEGVQQRKNRIRDKIRAVDKFMRMYSNLRNSAETVQRIKGLTEDSTLPQGVLLGGRLALLDCLGDFTEVQKADRPNLRRPSISVIQPTIKHLRLDADAFGELDPAPIGFPPPEESSDDFVFPRPPENAFTEPPEIADMCPVDAEAHTNEIFEGQGDPPTSVPVAETNEDGTGHMQQLTDALHIPEDPPIESFESSIDDFSHDAPGLPFISVDFFNPVSEDFDFLQ